MTELADENRPLVQYIAKGMTAGTVGSRETPERIFLFGHDKILFSFSLKGDS